MIFGNARRQPADPSYVAPSNRRVIWEHGQDLAVFLSVSVIFNIIFALAVITMGLVLVAIYNRPPFVLTQDQGYVYYRSTEVFKLRTDIIRTFLHVTTTTLLNINPGGYDISGLEKIVNPKVLQTFSDSARAQAQQRMQFNRRQIWYIRELRRYYDPKLPQYISIAIRGEKVNYEDVTTQTGVRDVKTTSTTTLLVTYLEQTRPSPDNPWGLILVGIYEESNPERAKAIWDQCVDLRGSTTMDGRSIEPPRPEFTPKL